MLRFLPGKLRGKTSATKQRKPKAERDVFSETPTPWFSFRFSFESTQQVPQKTHPQKGKNEKPTTFSPGRRIQNGPKEKVLAVFATFAALVLGRVGLAMFCWSRFPEENHKVVNTVRGCVLLFFLLVILKELIASWGALLWDTPIL